MIFLLEGHPGLVEIPTRERERERGREEERQRDRARERPNVTLSHLGMQLESRIPNAAWETEIGHFQG